MKVKFTKEEKKFITVAQMPAVNQIIKDMKEYPLSEDTQTIARVASGVNSTFEILKAEARIAKNCRVWNAFSDESENLDIWIEVYAFNNYDGFYEIGIYLSDVWQITGDNGDEIRSHMYINEYHKNR